MIISSLIILSQTYLFLCQASSAELKGSNCAFPDVQLDHKGITWLTSIEGEKYESEDDNKEYLYTVGICVSPDDHFKNASVIQKNLKDKSKAHVVIGRFNTTEIKIGTNWGLLEFGSGDQYVNHCDKNNRVAMIMITCNAAISKPIFRVIEENKDKISKCYYLFELEHPKICKPVPVVPVVPVLPVVPQTLGKGAIAMIIIVSLIAIYLCMGMAIKKLFYNAHGINVIPNLQIWRCVGETFSNCVETICRPRPLYRGLDSRNPTNRGNLTINDLEPDNVEDDDLLVLP